MRIDSSFHDRDSIFSKEVDKEVTAMGGRVLRTPVRAPKANSLCERFGGTLRRESLDFLIPFNERHLRFVLKTWIAHFCQGSHCPTFLCSCKVEFGLPLAR
jgi:putative transposase